VELPRVTLKLATSLDGRIALASGESKWITGPQSRAEVHRMRAQHDLVLTGIGTVLADDPLLTARTDPPPARQPVRAVLDSNARCPADAALLRAQSGQAVILTAPDQATSKSATELRAAGATILCAERSALGKGLDPVSVLARLAGDLAIRSVMIEAGAGVATAFWRAGLVSRLVWFRAPVILGGDARPALGELALDRLQDAPPLRLVTRRTLGADSCEVFERG
jgi:diaminohydroxyphosphoribosylaminopyrimidine deaminase/5-amino-6-(5-phosphoribosylamino)uracil reductase